MVKDYEYFRVSMVGPNCILLQWKIGISDDLVLETGDMASWSWYYTL